MRRLSRRAATATTLTIALQLATIGYGATPTQDHRGADAIARLRSEAFDRSQVMSIAFGLTDVIGPRLTNSPNLRQAQLYARDRLREWGVSNAHLERWGPFGRGWTFDAVSVAMTAPVAAPLIAYPKAWSSPTSGVVTADVVVLDAKSVEDVDRYRGKLHGRIVLASAEQPVPSSGVPQRISDSDLLGLANAPPLAPRPRVLTPSQQTRVDLYGAKWRLLYSEQPAVIIESGLGAPGAVYVTGAVGPPDARGTPVNPWSIDRPSVIPQLAMAPEHFNRLARLVAGGLTVTLRVNIAARYLDDDPMSDNVIGEIPGSDLKDEVVMFGGCLDSWHTGTGATDNAAGAAAALEAMRILRALDLHPRRSIRIGLWSAEEQGALGSAAYVAAHFGHRVSGAGGPDRIERGAEYDSLSAYFNLDWGPGKVRGIYLQGNEAARPVLREILAPFADLGASTLTGRSIGASDHMSFDEIGLPGFSFIRDFMEGAGGPGHTNMDVYDRLIPGDLQQSAAIVAGLVYQLAMRDEQVPRRPSAPAIAATRTR